MLVTDGYWNTGSPEVTSCSGTSPYGPCKIGTTGETGLVGDQDGVTGTVRPYLDSVPASNSLSDIAMYYWKTDLRPAGSPLGGLTEEGTNIDVSANNVPPSGADTATWQHMNTFAVGLGVPGVLNADNYLTGGSADYNAIVQGTKNWPDPQTGSSTQSVPARLDDLWHAAVNGRGQYLNVKTPSALTAALNSAISVDHRPRTAPPPPRRPATSSRWRATTSRTSRNTRRCSGPAICRRGRSTSSTAPFRRPRCGPRRRSCRAGRRRPRTRARSTRISPTATNKLKAFTPANLTTEIAANYFKSSSANPNGALSQYGGWSGSQQTAATDTAMINYIRGQSGSEMISTNANQLFRQRVAAAGRHREHQAGVRARAPVQVRRRRIRDLRRRPGEPRRAASTPRANDGMLHAFDATTGNEAWSYIPGIVVPQLYKLADAAYSTNHQFYVDGPIVAGDAYDGTNWKNGARRRSGARRTRATTRSTSPTPRARRRCGSSAPRRT